jgi:hypothetical protein
LSDCSAHFQGGLAVYCCTQGACIFGEAANSSSCGNPDAQFIQASDYDQSCATDSDCVPIAAGDFCHPNPGCSNAAINKSALARYQADIAKTYGAGSCTALSSCGFSQGPCCRQGTCLMNLACAAIPADTLPPCADAGGTCGTFVGCAPGRAGPPDACAYPDQTCCLP